MSGNEKALLVGWGVLAGVTGSALAWGAAAPSWWWAGDTLILVAVALRLLWLRRPG